MSLGSWLNVYLSSPIKMIQLGPANKVISTRPDDDRSPAIVYSGLFTRPPSNTPNNAPNIYATQQYVRKGVLCYTGNKMRHARFVEDIMQQSILIMEKFNRSDNLLE